MHSVLPAHPPHALLSPSNLEIEKCHLPATQPTGFNSCFNVVSFMMSMLAISKLAVQLMACKGPDVALSCNSGAQLHASWGVVHSRFSTDQVAYKL